MLLESICTGSANMKENKRNLEIPRTSYFIYTQFCLYKCRTIELSDYRAVGLAIGSPFQDYTANVTDPKKTALRSF